MRKSRWSAVLLLLIGAAVARAEPRQTVLLVFDEDKGLPGLALINRTLQETLTQATNGRVAFFTESLNLSQFQQADYEDILRDNFRRKYAGMYLDLIVAVMQPSLAFVLRHRQEIFRGVPIVFCGVDASQENELLPQPDVTGVVIKRTYAPSLDAALRLEPDVSNVFVTGGTSAFDRQIQAIARRDLAPYSRRLHIAYLTDYSMPDLLTRVAHLPDHSVVLYLTMFKDAVGQAFVPHDAAAMIASHANAPVYVAIDQYVGHGVVGGHVYSMETHVRQAADLGTRILGGEEASSIPIVEKGAYSDLYDWRQLQRWNLDESRLPAGSIVVNRTPSPWDSYKSYIAGGIAIVLLEAALILGLFVSRGALRRANDMARESERRRQEMEQELQRERNELAHALRLTTLGELTASFAHDLGQPLAGILTNAEVTHRMTEAQGLAGSEIHDAVADIEDDARRAAEILHRLRILFRKDTGARTDVDVNATIDDILRLLRSDLQKKKIWVRFTAADSLPPVVADPVQLRQVILNVVVNAEQAISSAGGTARDIHVETRREGDRVAICVGDTGSGAPESELQHMFERFVTTKSDGLGMGLTISRSIVESHGGRIWATRNEDRGLTLHIELPLAAPIREWLIAERR